MKTFISASMIALLLATSNAAFADSSYEAEDAVAIEESEFDLGTDDALHFDREYHRDRWVCYARNARGQLFRGVDRDRRFARREAMRECERFSRFCRLEGCDRR